MSHIVNVQSKEVFYFWQSCTPLHWQHGLKPMTNKSVSVLDRWVTDYENVNLCNKECKSGL